MISSRIIWLIRRAASIRFVTRDTVIEEPVIVIDEDIGQRPQEPIVFSDDMHDTVNIIMPITWGDDTSKLPHKIPPETADTPHKRELRVFAVAVRKITLTREFLESRVPPSGSGEIIVADHTVASFTSVMIIHPAPSVPTTRSRWNVFDLPRARRSILIGHWVICIDKDQCILRHAAGRTGESF